VSATAVPGAAAADATGDSLFGHPKGLYICFATELWERFSFYGMKYLLLLYLTKYHLFTDAAGLDVLGAYAGLVYALPVIGGLLADRYLGMRKAVVFGGILLALGHLLMAVEGHQAVFYAAGTALGDALTLADGTVLAAGTVLTEDVTLRDTAALNVFYLALALIVAGVGFLKPNISTIVGKLYGQDDPRRDSGFTIFYMGINIGSFTATLLCGWLGETYGWKYGFGAAGIGMVLGLVTFLWGQRFLRGHAEPADPAALRERVLGPVSREIAIYLATVASLIVLWLLLQHEPVVHLTQNVMLIVAITSLILFAMLHGRGDAAGRGAAQLLAGLTIAFGIAGAFVEILGHEVAGMPGWLPVVGEWSVYLAVLLMVVFVVFGFLRFHSVAFGRTVVLMVLILSTVVFWALFEQSAGSMTLFADRALDRELFGAEIKASQFGSLNAGFIMLLAIPFAMLWVWLAKRGLEPSTPVKFSLGIIQAGLGFGMLVLGAQFPNSQGEVAMIWLVLAYLLHTMGELSLSPVGLSAVTKLSIPQVVGVSMGTWFLATALAETVATRLAKIAAIDLGDGGEAFTAAQAVATYTDLFAFLMWTGLITGGVLLALSPLLRRGMHGIH
jgi:POT family proton-dependent oligopeptide transporter